MPKVLALEVAPVLALVGLGVLMTVLAEDTLRYMRATSEGLHAPAIYADGVFAAPRVTEGAQP